MSWQGMIVRELGENIVVGGLSMKASLKESTKATYSLAGRAYYVEGQCEKGTPQISVGDYFKRECDTGDYFIESVLPEPLADDVVYIYAIKSNCKIDILRATSSRNDSGDKESNFETVYSDVLCFKDVSTRSQKSQNDGKIDQTIYTIILPHKFMLSEGDRVLMSANVKGEEVKQPYMVESVGNQVVGSDTAQLSFDIRG